MISPNNKHLALLLLVAAGLLWGATPLLIRNANYNANGVAASRMLFSAVLLFFLSWPFRKHILSDWVSQWKKQALVGFCAAVSTTFFALACAYTNATHVYLLYYLFPVMLLAIDMCCYKSHSIQHIACVVIASLGLFVFSQGSFSEPGVFRGDFFAILSALSWVCYILLARAYLPTLESIITANISGQFIALVLFLPFVWDLVVDQSLWPTAVQGMWLLLLGACSAVPLLAWAYSMHSVAGHIAGVITMIEAPIGVLLCWYYLDISVGAVEVVGGLLILVSASACVFGRKE